jgi:hypothetical protein
MGVTSTLKKYLDPKKGVMFWISIAAFAIVLLLLASKFVGLNIPWATSTAQQIVT